MNEDVGTRVIKLNKFSFKFEDIDIIYPVYVKSRADQNKSHNFRRSIASGIRSRKFQLDHRSTQSYLFDKLIELGHFKLLGLDYTFIPELPIINTRSDIDKFRTYYLLDYFIPDLSLCIELDSDYHSPVKDKLKDLFLASIGIDVYRIYNFQSDTKDKLDKLTQYVESKFTSNFNLSYNSLIESFNHYIKDRDRLLYEKRLKEDPLIVLSNKWRPVIERLDKTILPGILDDIIQKRYSTKSVTLNNIFSIIPFVKKETRKYYPLINYLKGFNINLIITK